MINFFNMNKYLKSRSVTVGFVMRIRGRLQFYWGEKLLFFWVQRGGRRKTTNISSYCCPNMPQIKLGRRQHQRQVACNFTERSRAPDPIDVALSSLSFIRLSNVKREKDFRVWTERGVI